MRKVIKILLYVCSIALLKALSLVYSNLLYSVLFSLFVFFSQSLFSGLCTHWRCIVYKEASKHWVYTVHVRLRTHRRRGREGSQQGRRAMLLVLHSRSLPAWQRVRLYRKLLLRSLLASSACACRTNEWWRNSLVEHTTQVWVGVQNLFSLSPNERTKRKQRHLPVQCVSSSSTLTTNFYGFSTMKLMTEVLEFLIITNEKMWVWSFLSMSMRTKVAVLHCIEQSTAKTP
jgi:hypothetical protein